MQPRARLNPNAGPPCPKCHREMVPLFFSAACDWCEGRTAARLHQGFVVYRGADDEGAPRQEYVFRTIEDAERWRAIRALDGFPVHMVLSEYAFSWRMSSGTVQNLELADQVFTVYPNAGYPSDDRSCHLA